MKCPGCGSTNLQAINADESHFYCTDCNSGFQKGANKVEHGHLEFSGVTESQRIFKLLTNDRTDMTPEMKAALETQMTGIIFEQWFEGFKAGQLASIMYAKGFYNDNGKTRSKPKSTTGQHEEGTTGTSGSGSRREDSFNEHSGAGASKRNPSLRERINGIIFEYPNHIKVPENIYQQAAEITEIMSSNAHEIECFKYDGRKLNTVMKNR